MHVYASDWLVDGEMQISDWLAEEVRDAAAFGHEILPLRSGGVDGVTDEHLFFDRCADALLAICRVALKDDDGVDMSVEVVDFHVSKDGEYVFVNSGGASVPDSYWDAAYDALVSAIKNTNFYSGFGVCEEEKAVYDKKMACRYCRNRPYEYKCDCPTDDDIE